MDGETRGFRIVTRPTGSPPVTSRYQPPLEGEGDVGIPFHVKQGNQPSFRVEAGKTGLFLTCGGKLSVLLELGQVSLETSGVS